MDLLEKLRKRDGRVAVVGIGYVGLPLAVALAEAGFRVTGVDPDEARIEGVNQGRSHVPDVPSERVGALVRAKRLLASTAFDGVAEADAAVICVPTPLGKAREPDISFVMAATRAVAERAHRDMLVVLESTTYPGTTEEVVVPALRERGLTPGRDVFVAFSPERVDPGNRTFGLKNTPKVVSGYTPACLERAVALYSAVCDRPVPVSSPRAAEMVKLLENTFRAVNIALVNEVAIMCDKLGISVWEVCDAASTKPFGFMPFYPGPGLGGHCIPIDPIYLSWKLKFVNYTARIIDLATEINAQMPAYVVERATRTLNDVRKPIRGSDILILGVAYKRNVSDVRESPALDVMKHLADLGANVSYADPYVPEIVLDGVRHRSVPLGDLAAAVCRRDLVIICTDHSSVDYAAVARHAPRVLDCRNATQGLAGDHVVRL